MFKIIGGDGNEYGPVSTEVLRQWFSEGRVNGDTRAKREGGDWATLAVFPEFADLLTPKPGTPPEPLRMMETPAPFATADPKTIFEGDYQLDLGGCLTRGWEVVKANFGPLFGGMVVLFLIEMAIGMAGKIPILGALVSIVSLVITGPLAGGVLYLFLKAVRSDTPEVGDIFSGFKRCFGQLFLGYLVSSLIAGLCMLPFVILLVVSFSSVFVSAMHNHQALDASQIMVVLQGHLLLFIPVFLLSLIPMMYLQTCWMFSLPLIIDRDMEFWAAMKTSWRRVNVHWWQVFGLVVLVGLLNVAGFFLCCVGLLVSVPIGFAAKMLAYETIFSGKDCGA